ncbi:MAG: exosome complex RNA-binding protein Csl4 [Methanosarcinales archaeon]|nr:exosome complex RNA-binding protein Csl4 [Methanosarcinales archaeon]
MRKVNRNKDVNGVKSVDNPEQPAQSAQPVQPAHESAGLNSESENTGIFVLPGDSIGATEEFRAGDQTYESAGNIYATVTGTVKINTKDRTISIISSTSTPPVLQRGDVVIGQVTGLRDSLVLVTIAGVSGVVDRAIPNVGSAVIHVSNIKKAYVKDISREFGLFDIVKARISDLMNMRLDTAEPELGVMKALCSRCRTAMTKNGSKLVCPECNQVETRKMSTEYRTGAI